MEICKHTSRFLAQRQPGSLEFLLTNSKTPKTVYLPPRKKKEEKVTVKT